MTRFLSTTGVSFELEELINGAEERLVLISPFLRVNQRIRDLLADKDRMKIDTRVVYGKSELSPEQSEWLLSTPSIRTSYCANLHAKCYISEKAALITSMNLYEFSQVNNIEMGVLVERDADAALYNAINQEVQRILRGSEEHSPNTSKGTVATRGHRVVPASHEGSGKRPSAAPAGTKTRRATSRDADAGRPASLPEHGFCIRCGTGIPPDPTKPFCPNCYRSWARSKKAAHKEEYCHLCGKKHATTLQMPACRGCYRKYSGAFVSSGPA